MTTSAIQLAKWVRANVPQKSGALTQLKLQKLCFYAYGAALAFRVEDEIGDVPFEAWRHGPVNPEVFEEYRGYAASDLPPAKERVQYSISAQAPMFDALSIYSWLGAWQLRQQSHLEQPWRTAEQLGGRRQIDKESIREHFIAKFRLDVRLPEYLSRSWSFAIDGIPAARFSSLHELAETIRQRLG